MEANLSTHQQTSWGSTPGTKHGHGAGFYDICCKFLARDGGIGSQITLL